MELTVSNVNRVFHTCLFDEGEDTSAAVPVEGVVTTVGFNPTRLQQQTTNIDSLLDSLPGSFKEGMSFLAMCDDAQGNLWTGEHRTMDRLLCLGLATGKLSYLAPRDMWRILPGGMPYLLLK